MTIFCKGSSHKKGQRVYRKIEYEKKCNKINFKFFFKLPFFSKIEKIIKVIKRKINKIPKTLTEVAKAEKRRKK